MLIRPCQYLNTYLVSLILITSLMMTFRWHALRRPRKIIYHRHLLLYSNKTSWYHDKEFENIVCTVPAIFFFKSIFVDIASISCKLRKMFWYCPKYKRVGRNQKRPNCIWILTASNIKSIKNIYDIKNINDIKSIYGIKNIYDIRI